MEDEAMRSAAALTAKQLEKAIEIVEDEFGANMHDQHGPIVAATLVALAENYRRESARLR